MTGTDSDDDGELFGVLAELDADERARRLAALAERDPPRAARLIRLFRAAEKDVLREPPARGRDGVAEARLDDPLRGKSIGPYVAERFLGRGGMGAVYEARRTAPARRAALKVVEAGLFADSSRRRFAFEIEVLGALRHPGIAQLYEAGVADLGGVPLPWFAMEYVEGEPLDSYAARRRDRIPELVRALADVCDAVAHAHGHGVVHRDLKPSNILVEPPTTHDGAPRPRVLDFGVAKAVGGGFAASPATSTGRLLGTPRYMSPEQAQGRDDVDARSDVYALGVLIFESLTGARPYEVDGLPLGEAVRIVCEVDPAKLSSMRRELGGDLETIVAKATDKDRARRYADAGALGADLRRHLADLPIAARPASAAYLATKFFRRRRPLVLGLLFALVGSAAGVYGVWREGVAAAEARDRERAGRADAERSAYVAALSAADAALRAGDSGEARRRLDDAPVPRRGFEWHALRRRLEGAEAVLTAPCNAIGAVAFSTNGRRAYGAACGSLYVFDLATSRRVAIRGPFKARTTGVFAQTDGPGVVVATADGRLRLFDDPATDVPARVVAISAALDVAPRVRWAGGVLTAAGPDAAIRTYDAATATPLGVEGAAGEVIGLSPTGDRAVVRTDGAAPRVVSLRDPADEGTTLPAVFAGGFPFVAFSGDGRRVAAPCGGGALAVYDATTGAIIAASQAGAAIVALALDRAGDRLAYVAADRGSFVVDLTEAGAPRPLLGDVGGGADVAFAPDGRIAIGTDTGALRLYAAEDPDYVANARSAARLADGARLVAGPGGPYVVGAGAVATRSSAAERTDETFARAFGTDVCATTARAGGGPARRVEILRAGTGERLGAFDVPTEVVALALTRERIAVGDRESPLRLLRFDGGEVARAARTPARHACVSASGDGRYFAYGSADGVFVLLDAERGGVVREIACGGGSIYATALSYDGRFAVCGGSDRVARVLDVASGTVRFALGGHDAPVHAVAIDRDGRRAATCAGRGRVRVFDLADGAAVFDWRTGGGQAMALEFREDGAALSAVVAVRDRLDVATLDGGTAAERAIDASYAALYAPSRVAAAVAASEAVGVAPAALSAALRARRPSAADLNAVAWRLCAFRGADPAQYADALARASAAVEIDPDNGWFLNTYGCALLRAGRLTEAAATLERAAALNGDFGPDQSLLAVVRARLGERDAALAALEKARRLSGLPGDFDTLLAEAEAACRGL